jgi:hypothetical protein
MPTMIDANMSQDDPTTKRKRLDLTATQVVASAFAAVTATIGASFLGVAGTVIGAAVASVLTVVANAIYVDSLRRTRDRLASFVPTQSGSHATPWPGARDAPERKIRARPIPWRAVGIWAVAVFAVLVGLITVVEAAAGRPLTDILRNQPGHGTSILGGDSSGGGGSSTPTQGPSASVGTSQHAPGSSSPAAQTPSTSSSAPSSSSPTASPSTAPSSSAAQASTTPTPRGAATPTP